MTFWVKIRNARTGAIRWVPVTAASQQAAFVIADQQTDEDEDWEYVSGFEKVGSDPDWARLTPAMRTTFLSLTPVAAPETPIVPEEPLGPSGTVTGQGLDPAFREVALPFGAFLSGLQERGISGTQGPFAPVASRQFQPARATFLGRAALGGPQTEETPGTFQQFVAGTPFGQMGRSALNTFRQLLGPGVAASPEQQALTQRFRDPTSALGPNLALGAAGGAFGPFAAANLLPSAETLGLRGQQQAFEDPTASFLNFLRQSVGLTAGF